VSPVRIENVTLRATVAEHGKGPKDALPQVAFAGRSNVGKSSLLNSLFGQRLAAVSKTPGKTRTINYYLVNNQCYFVDLPGYGFARTGREQRQNWGRNVSTYLLEEERLRLVVGLVDPRVPTSPLDVDLVGFVRQAGASLLLVMTKADRMSRGALAQAAARIARELGGGVPPLAFSARTGAGHKDILTAIADALAS
jgi:GTP-binding protein